MSRFGVLSASHLMAVAKKQDNITNNWISRTISIKTIDKTHNSDVGPLFEAAMHTFPNACSTFLAYLTFTQNAHSKPWLNRSNSPQFQQINPISLKFISHQCVARNERRRFLSNGNGTCLWAFAATYARSQATILGRCCLLAVFAQINNNPNGFLFRSFVAVLTESEFSYRLTSMFYRFHLISR